MLFWANFGSACSWQIQAVFAVGEPFYDVGTPPARSSNNFTQGHLVKVEWLVANVTAVGSLDRAKRAVSPTVVPLHKVPTA